MSSVMKKTKKLALSIGLFSNFASGIHLKAKGSGYRNTWMEIEGQNSKKYHIFKGN